MGQRLSFSVFAGSLCGLLFGYDIGAIAGAAPALKVQLAFSAAALGVAVSSALVGAIAGSLTAGFVKDAIDRRQTLIIAVLLYLVAQPAAASSRTIVQFALSRLLCGIAVGLISVAAPVYLAEISPSHLRGRLVGTFQFCVSIGVVLAFAIGYLLAHRFPESLAWRWLLMCGAIPALFSAALLVKASPSPRWLALKGRFAEARAAFAALGSADPEAETAGLVGSLGDLDPARQPRLFSAKYAKPIFLAVSLAMFNQLTGVNAVLYYIVDIFHDLSAGQLNGRKDAILIAFLNLVVTSVAVLVIDRLGRKPLLLAGTVGMGACLGVLPAIHVLHWPTWTVIVIVACYNAFFGFSQGAVIWVYLSEIFPLRVRAGGQSLGTTVHWVTAAFVVGMFPVLINVLGGKVFPVFAVLLALQFLTILLVYPETKRTSLESLASGIAPKPRRGIVIAMEKRKVNDWNGEEHFSNPE